MKKTLFILVALASIAGGACAQVTVADPWMRATVPRQKVAGAFMQLHSVRRARVIGVNSPVAGTAEMHQMAMRGQVMTMQEVDGIDLPAGQDVFLGPGGYHIMLLDLKRQIREGDKVPLSLTVEDESKKRSTVTVDVPAKALTYANPRPAHAMQH